MNAYELADELQELDAKLHLIVLFKSAEMLRQQADRIAELEKKELNAGGEPVKNATYWKRQHDKLADRIVELEKQTFFIADPEKQGEPVAWMDEHENVIFEKNWAYPIPLYTSLVFCKAQQTKPLSEKELYEVFDKCYPNNGDGDVVTLVDFARAIEERHGIK